MNARKIILIAGVGMTLGCGRFFGEEPVIYENPPPPPPTGNPPGPTDSAAPPEDPEEKKSAVDQALEEGEE